MNKLLTVSIAAYNIEKYIGKTLESLIIDNMDILEVLVIDDGSTDGTFKIAKEYENKYPNTFKVIHKENGGYGSTINTAIKYATGKYFKQLDGDDWYETTNLNDICLELLKVDVDVVYTPYIMYYEKNKKKVIVKNNIVSDLLENDLNIAIEKTLSKSIWMHSLMYKTEILKKNKITLEENCYYTDTEYVIYPLIFAKKIKIFNMPLYIYRIGREGQSVSKKNRIKHYEDHIKVSYNLLNKSKELEEMPNNNIKIYLENYIVRHLNNTTWRYMLLLKPNNKNFEIIKEYENSIKSKNKRLHLKMEQDSKIVKLLRKNSLVLYKICYYYRKIRELGEK